MRRLVVLSALPGCVFDGAGVASEAASGDASTAVADAGEAQDADNTPCPRGYLTLGGADAARAYLVVTEPRVWSHARDACREDLR